MKRMILVVAIVLSSGLANADERVTGARPYQAYGAGAPLGWHAMPVEATMVKIPVKRPRHHRK